MGLELPQAVDRDNQEKEIELALRSTQALEKLEQLAHSFTGGEYDKFMRLRRHLAHKMRLLDQMNPRDKKGPLLHEDALRLS